MALLSPPPPSLPSLQGLVDPDSQPITSTCWVYFLRIPGYVPFFIFTTQSSSFLDLAWLPDLSFVPRCLLQSLFPTVQPSSPNTSCLDTLNWFPVSLRKKPKSFGVLYWFSGTPVTKCHQLGVLTAESCFTVLETRSLRTGVGKVGFSQFCSREPVPSCFPSFWLWGHFLTFLGCRSITQSLSAHGVFPVCLCPNSPFL